MPYRNLFPLSLQVHWKPSALGIFVAKTTTLPRRTCHHSASSVLAVRISCRVIATFVFREPLFTVIVAPKRKSSDTGSASKPKRSRDVLYSRESENSGYDGRRKKNCTRRLSGCMTRTNLPFVK